MDDMSAPGFAEECARQCSVLKAAIDVDLDAWLDAANQELADELDRLGQ
jgi:hypothetical protein